MDFINKGVAWARNICDTLEAMFLEVDDIMFTQHAEQANGSQDDMSSPTLEEVSGCKSFGKAEETNSSRYDMSPPTSDEVTGGKSCGKAGETNGSEDDMSPPTSDEVEGCNSFGKVEESSNLVNAIDHPSSALLSSCSDTSIKSIECEDKPAASATVSEVELCHYGSEAYNKFAESELSVSIPEIGKSDDKRCTRVAEPIKATIQASDYKNIAFGDLLTLAMESKGCYPPFCQAGKRRYNKDSQAPGTSSVVEVDKKMQAGDEVAGSNQVNDHDSWESDWVIV